ncbi:hypothetical protein GE061_017775 [Apolygus lucorum]|uniref:Uncharacterized protein n=1 Tax=Apolygus lucorum TaxID=248454 RepID=A0A8S9XE16_APOLU|nr:hypothetical protein GE061_017775 [Apolygus lucorum]
MSIRDPTRCQMEEESSDTSCLFSISTEPEEGDCEPSKILYYKEFSIFPEGDETPQPRSRFDVSIVEREFITCLNAPNG